MKKTIITSMLVVHSLTSAFSQQVPTLDGYSPGAPIDPNTAPSGSLAASAWYRGGNIPGNSGATRNLLGTAWNSPIYFITGGNGSANQYLRMKLNGVFGATGASQYSINGYTTGVNTTGYLLLGSDRALMTNPSLNLYSSKGAYSLLHLNGRGASVQEYGYRPWMQAGITFTDNSDLSYMGLRKLSTNDAEVDITETVIGWSDNPDGLEGPDKVTFRFFGYGGADGNTVSTNFHSNTDLDGLHVAQFIGTGLMGLGNTFGTNATGMSVGYVQPQSLYHQSYAFRTGTGFTPYGFMQITYAKPVGGSEIVGQGEAATDGLRIGIDNAIINSGAYQHLNGYVRYQEAASLVFQTEDNLTPNIQGNERLRMTSVGALIQNWGPLYLGITAPTQTTRIGVSHNGATPVTRPMSLMHLGYDVGTLSAGTDGWRNWMDIGTFTSSGSDHFYMGLKNEGGADKSDAVLNWGDNQASGTTGPDNLRFIFTAPTATGSNPATSANGLEGVRMTPSATGTAGVLVGVGGDPSANKYGPAETSINPTATLEVNGWGPTTATGGTSGLRFTNLKSSSPVATNPGTGVLAVNDQGDVIYVAGGTGTSTPGAHNGTSVSILDPTKVALGNDLGATSAQLLSNREIPMNANNLIFSGNGRLGIGMASTITPVAKLDIRPSSADPFGINVYSNNNMAPVVNYDMNTIVNEVSGISQSVGLVVSTAGTPVKSAYGIQSEAIATTPGNNIGVYGFAKDAVNTNLGGRFGASSSITPHNVGVQGDANSGEYNVGGTFRGGNPNDVTSLLNHGVFAEAWGGDIAYGIYATASQGISANYAAYFNGDAFATGVYLGSDRKLKTEIQPITNALSTISKLQPKTYYMDSKANPDFQFSDKLQYGFIAQEIQEVLPSVVKETFQPTYEDGQMTGEGTDFLAVNYNAIIPLNTQAIKELNDKVEAKDAVIADQQTKIDDLNKRLTQLENCLSALLPSLCEMNQQAIQSNNPVTQEEIRAQLSVKLSNNDAIILDQNVPNPFAEQTVINFSIPATVGKAQIHFYNGEGRLIQSVEVKERGLGSLTVFGSDLSFGAYSYTLVADGQIVSTRKMVKQ